ncbi:MAG: AMP-dependent synthetase/ligase [Pseudonocardiaceae bacterium]
MAGELSLATVAEMFRDRVRQTPHREAYRYPAGEGWVSRTWLETGERVTRLAAGLIALGIEPEQRVAIASATRYEWVLADLAAMCAGAATTTVYPSTISEDVAFILADSDSQVAFAENDDQIAKLREHRDALPSVRTVVTFDGTADGGDDAWVISLDRLAELGAAHLLHAAGILILEGYGLTETSAGSLVNRPDRFRFGTVGLPFPGTEVKIAGDGEILLRGPGVMDGYHHLESETRATFVGDGWLATGDIGEFDADGFLRITDRKKDLFKTSGGKYVAPSRIEGRFTAVCPLASQMVVHGNERNYCVALIALDPDAVADWASRHDTAELPYAEVVTSEAMRAEIEGYVRKLNAQLNRWEAVKKFHILERDLSVESGELTPSFKVKRRVVETNYRDTLNALYAG